MTFLAPLPVAVPLLVAAFLMACSTKVARRPRDLLAIGASLSVVVLSGLLLADALKQPIVYWFGGWSPRDDLALGIGFAIDPLGAGLALLAAILVTASLVFSWRYFDEARALFPVLMLVFLAALAGFCLTGDLFNLFVFFELMSVTAYALTGYKIEEEQALMGAFNFAITNSIGAFLVLGGIGLLYGRSGALNLAQLGRALSSGPADGLVIVALTLIVCGFGIKAALAPFHFWLADAHAVAPTPVCVLFSGVMVELGLYALARVYWTVFAQVVEEQAPILRAVWIGLGGLTALLGAVMCFAQRHLKRLLAFSTIGHSGAFLMGIALLTPEGLAGTALYILGHGLVKGALFLGVGILLNRFASVDENRLRGAGRRFPWLGLLFLTGGLALSGLPPFSIAQGKGLLEESAGRLGYSWVSPTLLVVSILTGGAVLRATGQIFLGLGPPQDTDAGTPTREEKETKENYDRPPLVMLLPMAGLLLLALLTGLWPALEQQVQQAASRLEDQHAYAAAVLDGKERPQPPTPGADAPGSPAAPHVSGVFWGIAAAAGAVLAALLALFPRWIPRRVRSCARSVGNPLLAGLRSLHSGNVADYVAWIVAGVAGMGGLLAFLTRA